MIFLQKIPQQPSLVKMSYMKRANSRQTILTPVNFDACGHSPFTWHIFFRNTYALQITQCTSYLNILFLFFILHLLSWKLIINVLIYVYLFKKVRNVFILLFCYLHAQTQNSYKQKRPVGACLSCYKCRTVYLLMLFYLFLRTFQFLTLYCA